MDNVERVARSYFIEFNAAYISCEKVLIYVESLAHEVGAEATEHHTISEDSLMWVVFHQGETAKWPEAESILSCLGVDSVIESPMMSGLGVVDEDYVSGEVDG